MLVEYQGFIKYWHVGCNNVFRTYILDIYHLF